MLNPHILRNTPDLVRKDLKKRHAKDQLKYVDQFLSLDEQWRKYKQETEKLRAERNTISRVIAKLKKEGKKASQELKEASEIPDKIAAIEQKQNEAVAERDKLLYKLPNILHETVPEGENENDNVEIKKIGKKPVFSFVPKSHVDLLAALDIADLERAAKISGTRFWFLKGDLARLDLALQQYAIEFMHSKGYTILRPPFMMNRKSYEGVVDLQDFENVMYKIEGEDLYLIATSEHPLTAMFLGETLESQQLPLKLAGISSCFRKEAGTHGKDTKGIFRGHQFDKVEQIVICKPEESWKFHEELLDNAAAFFESLGLHFRIINICSGDIGVIAAKKYDIEVWMPAQETYREVVSCSNCTDYQARRLQLRYRTGDGNPFVYTLNSTCVATSRALVAILENFQDNKGNINIPKVLQPYMSGQKMIKRK